tara:strand:+ start:75 stop:737 length:663 start_codon:yes stop_codon:yes gene_type:complete
MDYKKVKEELDRLSKELKNPITKQTKKESTNTKTNKIKSSFKTIGKFKSSDIKEIILNYTGLPPEWSCSEISKFIVFSNSRNLYPIFNKEELGSYFGLTYSSTFIHPYGGSFDLSGNILTLRGYYIGYRRKVDEDLVYLMSGNHDIHKDRKPKTGEYEIILDNDNPYINTGVLSPSTNRIIELKFKIIKIIDKDTLEFVPINFNSELFTFNRKSTIWKRQ